MARESRFHFFDDAFVRALDSEANEVADGDDASAVDGEGFQQAADGAAESQAVIGFDDRFESVDFDDAAEQAVVEIDRQSFDRVFAARGGPIVGGFDDDGSFPRQSPLARTRSPEVVSGPVDPSGR